MNKQTINKVYSNEYTKAIKDTSLVNNFSSGYSFKSNLTNNIMNNNENITSLLSIYFSNMKKQHKGLIFSSPLYSHTSTKITVQVFYYIAQPKFTTKIIQNTDNVVKNSITVALKNTINCISGKKVSLQFVRIHYPYLNSSIFSQYLSHNAFANTFVQFQNSILTSTSRNASALPGSLSGIRIQVSGRMTTERIVPRITQKSYGVGTTHNAKTNYTKYTHKNFFGAYTIKV